MEILFKHKIKIYLFTGGQWVVNFLKRERVWSRKPINRLTVLFQRKDYIDGGYCFSAVVITKRNDISHYGLYKHLENSTAFLINVSGEVLDPSSTSKPEESGF